jgi:hypothetical protein
VNAATPAEWAEALSLALMLCGTAGGLFFLTVDADPADFDPRPAVRRAVESGRLDPALIAVVNARHTAHDTGARVRAVGRNTAVTAAALCMLLTLPEATR